MNVTSGALIFSKFVTSLWAVVHDVIRLSSVGRLILFRWNYAALELGILLIMGD